MIISARVVLDSEHPEVGRDARLTTFLLTYPRFIHSELMTHRVFSRNSASSRAIPFKRMQEMVRSQPAMPAHWGSNKPGMQAGEEIEGAQQARYEWLKAMEYAVGQADVLHSMGVHKQVVNRLIEPFMHMTCLVTATDFANFFALRSHPDAQPEIQRLSDAMLLQYMTHEPKTRSVHIPFVTDEEHDAFPLSTLLIRSVARCARTSYATFDQVHSDEEDAKLYTRLQQGGHWSPFEHIAFYNDDEFNPGNFRCWRQLRHNFVDDRNRTNLQKLAEERGLLPRQ